MHESVPEALRADEPGRLETLWRSHVDRRWIFVQPGGNWGDRLIYEGAEALARRVGIEWATFDADALLAAPITRDDYVYLHGGGGYNPWGTGRPFKCLSTILAHRPRLVVQGPVTIAPDASTRQWLQTLLAPFVPDSLVVLARERTSLGILQSLGLRDVQIGIDHDTALHANLDDLLRLAALHDVPRGRYDLTVLREDDEQPAHAGGTLARGIVLDPGYVAETFGHWLRIHLFASTILTNRLHSAIAGLLAGKPVVLAGGSYHKNRSLWEYSLGHRGVGWTDGIQTDRRLWSKLPNRLRDSYKLGKLRLAMQHVPLR